MTTRNNAPLAFCCGLIAMLIILPGCYTDTVDSTEHLYVSVADQHGV